MSAHPQPSPPGGIQPHQHGHMAAHPQQQQQPVNGHMPMQSQNQKGPALSTAQKIAQLNEGVWLQIGMLACRNSSANSSPFSLGLPIQLLMYNNRQLD